MRITGIIPSRYASQRLPGKPLAMIKGTTMIQRVFEQVLKCSELDELVVATDNEKIFSHVLDFGGKAIMTSQNHYSGTDRCYEAACKLNIQDNDQVIVNIQGDEPFINPQQITDLIGCFKSDEVQIATLVKKITHNEDVFNVSKPKVVVNNKNQAMYFSRSPVPYMRNVEPQMWFENHSFLKHIGLYGYRFGALKKIASLPASPLERAESLEQLRWLENGFIIQTELTQYESVSIDTIEDLENINKESDDFS
ncbi:MAG: 3-deoxy-manno-octulosonate cytidylyltransferase [Bacteroidetes bacterium]|nr:3-deoxy-manno-octulosonate cytidylyltransferase [Bacteroidota bacterium]HET6245552.1 3-deoxy-manno-octulosonate cytidylyltransferase [Bacteroidia bacterium]